MPSDPADERAVYRERNALAAVLAALFPSALTVDPDPDLHVLGYPYLLFVDSPHGQLSWHLPKEDLDLVNHVPVVPDNDIRVAWDGHTIEDKHQRLGALAMAVACDRARANGGPVTEHDDAPVSTLTGLPCAHGPGRRCVECVEEGMLGFHGLAHGEPDWGEGRQTQGPRE